MGCALLNNSYNQRLFIGMVIVLHYMICFTCTCTVESWKDARKLSINKRIHMDSLKTLCELQKGKFLYDGHKSLKTDAPQLTYDALPVCQSERFMRNFSGTFNPHKEKKGPECFSFITAEHKSAQNRQNLSGI